MDTALKVSRPLYCFITSISHGVENYFPRLWDMGISDAIFCSVTSRSYCNHNVYIYFCNIPRYMI